MNKKLFSALSTLLLAITCLIPASYAETPQERCQRETQAYNRQMDKLFPKGGYPPYKCVSVPQPDTPPGTDKPEAPEVPEETPTDVPKETKEKEPPVEETTEVETPKPKYTRENSAEDVENVNPDFMQDLLKTEEGAQTQPPGEDNLPPRPEPREDNPQIHRQDLSTPANKPSDDTSANDKDGALFSSCEQKPPPDQIVDENLLDYPMSGPETTRQGQYGDCWLIANYIGLQQSEAGRAGLRKMVTKNPSGGYDVRMQNKDGDCETIHVTHVYSRGATDYSSPSPTNQGVISIIESAAYQQNPDAVSCGENIENSSKVFAGSEGSRTLDKKKAPFSDETLPGALTDNPDEINAQIAEGRAVTLSTETFSENPEENYKGIGTTWMVYGQPIDGQVSQIQGNHLYTVTKATPDGVWVRNPWGNASGNTADRGHEFFIPKDQITTYFDEGSVTAPIGDAPCLQ